MRNQLVEELEKAIKEIDINNNIIKKVKCLIDYDKDYIYINIDNIIIITSDIKLEHLYINNHEKGFYYKNGKNNFLTYIKLITLISENLKELKKRLKYILKKYK